MPQKRWPRILVAIVVLALIGGFAVAFVSARRLADAVPGKAPLLGLGRVKAGFIVGTERGVYTSKDGENWTLSKKLPRRPSLIASNDEVTIILSNDTILQGTTFSDFTNLHGAVQPGAALGIDVEGNVYIAEKDATLTVITTENVIRRNRPTTGPREVIAIDGIPGDPVTLFTGGLSSGFWRFDPKTSKWRQVLKTPTRALIIDPDDPKRVFAGTAGGLLISKNGGLRWDYADFREPIEALTTYNGDFFALTADRLVYRSPNGDTDWERVQD